MATTVVIGGETFYATAPPVAPGPGYTWHELRGWGDGAAAEVGRLPRGGGSGETFTTGRYGALELTLRGVALCGSWAEHYAARDRIAEVFDCVRLPKLLVVDEPEPKQAEVRRDGTLHLAPLGLDLRFEVPLIAEDPRRYSTTETTHLLTIASGQTTVSDVISNSGTADTEPEVRITGPADNPRLMNVTTDEELELTGVLASTDTLTVDFRDQRVLLNDAPADYVATGDAWWSLAPGDNTIRYRVLTSAAASSTAQVVYRSAWS